MNRESNRYMRTFSLSVNTKDTRELDNNNVNMSRAQVMPFSRMLTLQVLFCLITWIPLPAAAFGSADSLASGKSHIFAASEGRSAGAGK